MKSKRLARIDELSPAAKEVVAENMKERVYSIITLIAVLTVMWQHAGSHSVRGTIAVIAGSVIALWLATLISIRMSHRAVHGKAIGSSAYQKAFFASSGLLAPAISPILIIAIGGLSDWYTLKTALMAGIVVSLLSLFWLSFNAGRRIYDNVWRLLLVSALEMSVGLLVVVLKLVVGE